jgi:hypothetical protein
MKASISRDHGAEAAVNATEAHASTRECVLEAACELFADSGIHETHLRDIYKRAGTNVAGECVQYSLADETVEDPWSPLAARLPNRACFARLITQRSPAYLDHVFTCNQPETLGTTFS